MHGFINVLKPPGMTSHDVVGWMRKNLGIKKIGHTGTLDPAVPGVLVLAVGQATRLVEYVMEHPKSYRCEMRFGLTTTTQDLEGRILQQRTVKREQLAKSHEVCLSFAGKIKQIPPMVSAVHFQGKRLYELARQGIEVEREPREVYIYKLEIVEDFFNQAPYGLMFDVSCSRGTYIRTLCHDIGEALGCGAAMAYLLRTASGPFDIADAWTLEELKQAITDGDYSFLLPPDIGIGGLPEATVEDEAVEAVLNGVKIFAKDLSSIPHGLIPDSELRVYSAERRLLAIGSWQVTPEYSYIRIRKVFK